MLAQPGFSPVRFEGIRNIPYIELYNSCRSEVFSVKIWMRERTEFHRASASLTRESKVVPSVISLSRFSHARFDDRNEMPTREDTFVLLKVKTPPSLSFPETEDVVSYDVSLVVVPLNVFESDGSWLKRPQKYISQSGDYSRASGSQDLYSNL